jgi:DUF1680 family protein
MYAGMADVAAITGDTSYIRAIDAIWQNVVDAKLYVTGGIGARADGEAFGKDYELPNGSAYNETCAAIGNVYWNHRLYLLHADDKYIDVLERTLYNGLISGISLDGKGFFYPNPLESDGTHARSPWFGCACCPSNICRFMASIPGYVYAQRKDELFVNLFASGTGRIRMESGETLVLRQETGYPWDGSVRITVDVTTRTQLAISVRIPGWARNEAVPSDLYRFGDESEERVTLKVNGEAVELRMQLGYVTLRRQWNPGDIIELRLPMPVRRILANNEVAADRSRVALQRGPIVYCVEWPDHEKASVLRLLLKDKTPVFSEWRPDLLGGMAILKSTVTALLRDDQGETAEQIDMTAIPYYAWAHRGKGPMAVWLLRDESALPTSAHTISDNALIRKS